MYRGRLRYSNRAVIIVLLKVSYSCSARKIASAVPSHRARLACYGPFSIVIIDSYLNGNIAILDLAVKYSVAQVDI